MGINTSILERIGLTGSEVKVYLALLKTGSATKREIVRVSGISPSKLYEVMDKLIDKGLVSAVKQNKVLHFTPAPPSQVAHFLEEKENELKMQADELDSLLPSLVSLQKEEGPVIEVFRGWKGLNSAYNLLLDSLKKGDHYLVIGASSGHNERQANAFFSKHHRLRREKGVRVHMVLDQSLKKWASLNLNKRDKVKFVKGTAPSETLISNDRVMITMLSKVPVVTIIQDKATASAYQKYFKDL